MVQYDGFGKRVVAHTLSSNEDMHKPAFICAEEQYEWQRMPFGLVNAQAAFNRAVHTALQALPQMLHSDYLRRVIHAATKTQLD